MRAEQIVRAIVGSASQRLRKPFHALDGSPAARTMPWAGQYGRQGRHALVFRPRQPPKTGARGSAGVGLEV